MGLRCTWRGVTVNRGRVTMRGGGSVLRFSVIASGVVAALVGFGGTLAIVVEATRHLGATPAQTSSWVASLCLGMAVTSVFLSARYRMPLLTAWSLAGLVLIAVAPAGIGMGDAIGAFLFSGLLMVLAGAMPALGRAIAHLPASIAGGMLAGLLLHFSIGAFQAAQEAPGLILPLFAVFLVARLLHAASAPLVVIAAAVPLALLEGYTLPMPDASFSTLTWIAPSFSVPALVGLGRAAVPGDDGDAADLGRGRAAHLGLHAADAGRADHDRRRHAAGRAVRRLLDQPVERHGLDLHRPGCASRPGEALADRADLRPRYLVFAHVRRLAGHRAARRCRRC